MVQPWFADAKLGIFIHWGLYAVKGVEESWAFFRGDMPHDEYMAQKSGFTADRYDPEAWADAIAGSGARYAVVSSRHHEGLALWDTAFSDLSVPKATPAGRDVLSPLCEAVTRRKLRLGIYYSLGDWNHPDYASVFHGIWGKRYNQGIGHDAAGDRFGFCYPADGIEKPEAWKRYLSYMRSQISELQASYDPDLFWFDGDWERSAEQWGADELAASLRKCKPEVMINSRLCGRGDYATPEQSVPFRAPDSAWETCMTMNDSWGYRPKDTNFKSPRRIIRLFSEIVGMGGNLLLDIGPRADGSIPEPELEILAELGRWNRINGEAVFGSRAGMPPGHFYGPSTLSPDRKTLYLFLSDPPGDEISIRGLRNRILQATVLGGDGRSLPVTVSGGANWYDIPGTTWIDVRGLTADPSTTVLKLSLDAPLSLYDGADEAFGVVGAAR